MSIQVSALYFYPIKSCAGTTVAEAQITGRGIRFDREWMLVDDKNVQLTQRELPRMALINPIVGEDGGLSIAAGGMPVLDIPADQTGISTKVRVWNDDCLAIDQGDDASEWLSSFLQARCRLVRMAPDFQRKVAAPYARRAGDQLGFADGMPFLLISEASLEDLNRRLAEKLPMNRFRPNIVVRGCSPFAEDVWRRFKIRDIEFDVVKPCDRCVITTTDQETAVRGKEPLKTLATYRRIDGKILFGQNLTHSGTGPIAVGDLLTMTS